MTTFERRIISVGVSAIKESRTTNKFNHATLIVHQGRILTIGVNNQYKTHTKASRTRPLWAFQHSELSTIIRFKNKCGIDLSRTTGYNIRLGDSGNILMSRPCVYCQQLIISANFKNFYYTNNLGLFEKFIFR